MDIEQIKYSLEVKREMKRHDENPSRQHKKPKDTEFVAVKAEDDVQYKTNDDSALVQSVTEVRTDERVPSVQDD